MKDLAMSLKDFHVVFITASALLSLGFACWGFVQYQELHSHLYAGTGLLSFVATIGLVMYEIRFIRKMRSYEDR